ncbi:MAG: arginyl-tRNA--protein-N-Asp/Glu arginylyltransferase [Oleiphilaceae bacterium]|jgi:arginine-tRNA-protein transferase
MTNLQTLAFFATPEHDCSYLPNQKATTMFADPKAVINNSVYSQLSELGFRRSGDHYYRPLCTHCNACTPIRIPVSDFQASRSQKRILKKNQAVKSQVMAPDFHEDHYLLYEKYINERHADGDMYPPSRDQYRSFLVNCQADTQFVEFSLEGHLCGIAVTDQLEDGLSAIYTFFDPEQTYLSLGTYAILWQINETIRRQQKYLYLGYFIQQCRKMTYKNQFKPFEARINDTWVSNEQLEKQILLTPKDL